MITNRLIHFEKELSFKSYLESGSIPRDSIVFIKDVGKIWTHGKYYTEYDKIKSVLFGTGPESLDHILKVLRADVTKEIEDSKNSILGEVSEDYNTLQKIEEFLKTQKVNNIVEGNGIKITEDEEGNKEISVKVDEESVQIDSNKNISVKSVDGGMY